ncbi:MAG: hypothetical protein ACFFAO_11795, partial [Candidatus Hermodarchaeota archaeon]
VLKISEPFFIINQNNFIVSNNLVICDKLLVRPEIPHRSTPKKVKSSDRNIFLKKLNLFQELN